VKMKLSYKIFAVFLLTSFMIVALMIGIMQFYISHNFSDYVNRVELEKLDGLSDKLGKVFQKHRGWNQIRTDRRFWFLFIKSSLNASDMPPLRAGRHGHNKSFGPPGDPFGAHLMRRLSLFDARKHLVAGHAHSPKNHTLEKITVNGETVGWLGLRKRERLSNPLNIGFMKQQFKAFYLIGIGIFLIAAIVSFLLARHLLAPIRKLIAGTRALASRKFETRIDVHTSDELGQLAADFNAMAQTLEKYEQRQQQWLSDISHELRTPLSILQGEIEAIQDGLRDMSSETLGSLHSEALSIGKIVNDLHDLSLAETGALYFKEEPVDPVQVLKDTLNLFKTRFTQHQIATEVLGDDSNATLAGDPDRLAQLFSNIFENTLSYAATPGTLKIRLERMQNSIVLSFEDSGPGVPEESVERLFDRLYRVDPSRNRKKHSSGLGLSICKKIVEAHKGNIKAENSPAGGLRIQIELPLEAQEY